MGKIYRLMVDGRRGVEEGTQTYSQTYIRSKNCNCLIADIVILHGYIIVCTNT